MVLDDQYVLHDGCFFHAYCHLHGDVVDMDQVQWLSTQDRLQRGYLGFSFEDASFQAVTNTHHHPLSHARPPKPFLEQA